MTDKYLVTCYDSGEMQEATHETYEQAVETAERWAEWYRDIVIWKRVAAAQTVTVLKIEAEEED